MEAIMPSVRHFAGPGLLIEALLNSKLAKQMELLEFHEAVAFELGRLDDLLLCLNSLALSELPNLKGLGLFILTAMPEQWEMMLDVLFKFAVRAPMLKELLLCPISEGPTPAELDRLLQILGHFPHLRKLVIHVEDLISPHTDDDNIEYFYEHAKRSCPLLDIMDINPMLTSSQIHSPFKRGLNV
ncbi:unnamed protein product [Rhizoctonia solani]|uniref:Uncharacterized protein n=1 Tax=Rhizoctonia solani TaxID=456999 RepID=A0A8H3I241_9AGAM|nr:unnamed protein product [Rhizoctonia solani]